MSICTVRQLHAEQSGLERAGSTKCDRDIAPRVYPAGYGKGQGVVATGGAEVSYKWQATWGAMKVSGEHHVCP
jgi:hypothetical protein